jgi:hypothetical protein
MGSLLSLDLWPTMVAAIILSGSQQHPTASRGRDTLESLGQARCSRATPCGRPLLSSSKSRLAASSAAVFLFSCIQQTNGIGMRQPGGQQQQPVGWPQQQQPQQQQQEPFGCFFSCGFLFSCIRQTNDFGMRQPGGQQQQAPVGWPQQQQPQQQQGPFGCFFSIPGVPGECAPVSCVWRTWP